MTLASAGRVCAAEMRRAEPSASPVPLDYAPPPPWHARRRARHATSAVLILLILLIGVRYLPLAWRNIRLYYWQQRCLAFAHPAGHETAVVVHGGAVPREWQLFYQLLSPPGLMSHGTVYLHEARTPDGKRRLVAIDVIGSSHGDLRLTRRVFDIASLLRPPSELAWPANGSFLLPQSLQRNTVLFFGSPDPRDASHFTIDYLSGGDKSTIDGWLQKDNTVVLEPRHPTLAPPPPKSHGIVP